MNDLCSLPRKTPTLFFFFFFSPLVLAFPLTTQDYHINVGNFQLRVSCVLHRRRLSFVILFSEVSFFSLSFSTDNTRLPTSHLELWVISVPYVETSIHFVLLFVSSYSSFADRHRQLLIPVSHHVVCSVAVMVFSLVFLLCRGESLKQHVHGISLGN